MISLCMPTPLGKTEVLSLYPEQLMITAPSCDMALVSGAMNPCIGITPTHFSGIRNK